MSLLPRPITEERISADWFMTTSAQLGGDGLGYHWIGSDRFAFYLLDVSGHGVKSALLAVSIIDTLRTCGLADTDWNDPGAVLRALNRVDSRNRMITSISRSGTGSRTWHTEHYAMLAVGILPQFSAQRNARIRGWPRAVRQSVALVMLITRR